MKTTKKSSKNLVKNTNYILIPRNGTYVIRKVYKKNKYEFTTEEEEEEEEIIFEEAFSSR